MQLKRAETRLGVLTRVIYFRSVLPLCYEQSALLMKGITDFFFFFKSF